MPQLIIGVVPGRVEMVVPVVNGNQIPHVGYLCAAVIAADQGAGDAGPVHQKLHRAGIPLAYRFPLHERTIGGKGVWICCRRGVVPGGFGVVNTALQQGVVQEQLRLKGIAVGRDGTEQRIDLFIEPNRGLMPFGGIHGEDQTKRIVVILSSGLIALIAVRIPDKEKFRMVPGKGGIQLLRLDGADQRLGQGNPQAGIGAHLAGVGVLDLYRLIGVQFFGYRRINGGISRLQPVAEPLVAPAICIADSGRGVRL